ncbi:uncharacterized protein LOC133699474 isoform X2 [Populus nigra]|uniref:uncharacterized protein LOC133699474 isoform X2 n=1 Tax=Populus nigra TaxID=3691 RepID=UPI002B274FF7|nr:uncharacterized protein LOC133699474 isoform X2 [Populus nigra]
MLLGCCRFPLTSYVFANTRCRDKSRSGLSRKAATRQIHASNGEYNNNKRKVVIVGSGWAGLGAAYHLCNQGFDVTVLGDGYDFGDPDDVGIHVIDFDNTDTAWRKYDSVTTRELLKQAGFSERLYQDVFGSLLQVGLCAPLEQCSAAAALGMLQFMAISHQGDLDMVWCRGSVKERIFNPWIELMSNKGCQFVDSKKVIDFSFDEETGCISDVVCDNETYKADAVILAVGISTVQELTKNSAALNTREEFLKVLNLAASDLVSTKLWLDKKIRIPFARNVCSSFDDSSGWTFFNLNELFDEHRNSPVTIVQADFYHGNELVLLKDEYIATKVMSYLSKCVKDFEVAHVTNVEIARFPKSLTHFFPGSYKYMMRGSTSFPNLFMAGDWIISRHGSWSQEKSYVTGLEGANRVVDFLGEGNYAKIISLDEDEPHIQALRNLNRNFKEFSSQFPLSDYFLQ